ncbi:hypothetical protein BSKO_12758 [Bryopsis sp. KO-2023]|nr:hypothetical protein BSKO_12758 [Bryopsis sp. KO-2023]
MAMGAPRRVNAGYRFGGSLVVKGRATTKFCYINSHIKPGRLSPTLCFPEFVEGAAEVEVPTTIETLDEGVEVASGDSVAFDKVVQAVEDNCVPLVTEPSVLPTLPSELLDQPINELTEVSQASEIPTEALIFTDKVAKGGLKSEVVDRHMESEEMESPWAMLVPDFIKDWFRGAGGERNKSLVLLNIMTFLFSTNYVVVKDAEQILDPYTFSALRFIVAALAFAPFLCLNENKSASTDGKQPFHRTTILAGVEIGIWSTLGYLTQTLGMKYTDASKAAFLGGLLVVMVPMFGGLMGKKITKVKWAGAALAVLGTSFLEQGSSTAFGVGDLFCLSSAMLFGLQMIRTEAHSKALQAGSVLSVLGVATATTALVSTGIAISAHPGEALSLLHNLDNHTAYVTTSLADLPWPVILYTGALTTALVLFIEMTAFQNVTATDAAIVYTIQPVMSGIMALTFLGERFTTSGWVGAAIIVCGSLGAQLLGTDEPDRSSEGEAEGKLVTEENLVSSAISDPVSDGVQNLDD